MAKLKYEFLNTFYENHPRKLRDYIFAYIGTLGHLGTPFAGAANFLLADPAIRKAAENLFGLASQRPFPRFAKRSLHSLVSKNTLASNGNPEKVLFLADAFTEYFNPQVGLAALRVLSCGWLRSQANPCNRRWANANFERISEGCETTCAKSCRGDKPLRSKGRISRSLG